MASSFDEFLNILQEAAIAYSRRQQKEAIHSCSNNGSAEPSSPLSCHSSISPSPNSLFQTQNHHHHSSSSLTLQDDLICDTQFGHELCLPLINSPMPNFTTTTNNNTNDALTLQQYQGWWDDFFPTPSSPSSYALPLSSHQLESNNSNISTTTLSHESTPASTFYSTYHATQHYNSISQEDSFSSSPPLPPPKDNNLNMASKKIKLTSFESCVDKKDVAAKQKERRVKKDVAKWIIMTRSQIDVMDDGFRWRKYGQKSVKKNAAYPRSYYKCTHIGCGAQKRVERCAVDNENVLTTYHGIHNHSASS